MDFKSLHQQGEPLLIGNVWDVPSAIIFEKLNFKAIGTSSAAIAHMLGYEDGEQMPFSELEFIVKKIISTTNLPLSVDIESGYSNDVAVIIENIERLFQLGVTGINIEDSRVTNNTRNLADAVDFGKLIIEIKKNLAAKSINMFINVRTDAFLLGLDNALEETLRRINIYEKAGADGVFVPCNIKSDEISRVVSGTSLPVNVMCMPDLPCFQELKELGVKRISMGNFMHQAIYNQMEQKASQILKGQSFISTFA